MAGKLSNLFSFFISPTPTSPSSLSAATVLLSLKKVEATRRELSHSPTTQSTSLCLYQTPIQGYYFRNKQKEPFLSRTTASMSSSPVSTDLVHQSLSCQGHQSNRKKIRGVWNQEKIKKKKGHGQLCQMLVTGRFKALMIQANYILRSGL